MAKGKGNNSQFKIQSGCNVDDTAAAFIIFSLILLSYHTALSSLADDVHALSFWSILAKRYTIDSVY